MSNFLIKIVGTFGQISTKMNRIISHVLIWLMENQTEINFLFIQIDKIWLFCKALYFLISTLL